MENILLRHKKKIGIVVVILIIAVIGILFNETEDYYEKIELRDGWEVYKDGIYTTDVDLKKKKIGITEKDESVYIAQSIQEDIDNPMLVIRAYHVTIDVKINGKTIYLYGEERYANNKSVGGGYHYIKLPNDYVGKRISIRFVATEENAMSSILPIELVDSSKHIKCYFRENLFGIICTYIMISVGFLCVIISLIAGMHRKNYRKIFYIGMTALDLGIWIQSYLGYSQILVRDGIMYYYMEHLALFFIPTFILLYFYESIRDGLFKKVIKILFAAAVSFIVLIILLEVLNIIHFVHVIPAFHILAIVCIATIVYATFSNHMKNKKARMSICVGIVLLAISLIVELIQFIVVNNLKGDETGVSLLVFGGFSYVTCMVISYMFYLLEHLKKQAKEKTLRDLAYGDMLTGLSNRKCCEDKLVYIDRFNVKRFAIINFDLNWLKKINDSLGHSKGDEYICGFADVLHKCIDEYGMAGRMGGDEFIAIIEEGTKEVVEDIIEKMNSMTGNGNMPETRQMGEGISFAYGYAISTVDEPLSSMKAYEIADRNMYKCKEEQKAGRK